MQRKSCKTLLTICNFQKKCERALAKRQSAIANSELPMANLNPVNHYLKKYHHIFIKLSIQLHYIPSRKTVQQVYLVRNSNSIADLA